MSLDRSEVEQVARLAKLSLDDGEIESLTHDLSSILDHMRDLAEADLEGAPAISGIGEHTAPMRADARGADALHLSLEELAPESADRFFVVPRLAALDADARADEGRTP